MNNNVRKITDGAMMTAVVGLLVFINRQFFGIAEMFVWILPLPMVFFTAKYGWKDGLLPLTAMILLTLLLGNPQSIYYFIVTAFTGLIYGEGVRRKWTLRKLMIVSLIISIISNLVTTVLFASFFGYDIAKEAQTMQQLFEQAMGSSVAALPIDLSKMIKVAMAFSILFIGVMEGTLVHMTSRLMLTRLGFDIPKAKPLSQIDAPKWTGYVAIVCWAGAEYFLRTPQNETLQVVMMFVNIIANIYLLYYGYLGAVVLGAVKLNKNISLYLVLLSIIFLNIAIPALSLFGFLYITTNWREDLLRRISNGQTK
ncbi:MAG: DUF2232 domain-containing protein [Anaerorhabdus sp.]|jgi:uncharacterized protein YybS (DUF2232 family)